MKKVFLGILLSLLTQGLMAEQMLFKSNEMGMPLERIRDFRKDEFEYTLSVTIEGEAELRELFQDGESVKKWEKRSSDRGFEETYYEEGELKSITWHNEAGAVQEETSFEDGAVVQRREYVYRDRVLEKILLFDGEDNLVWTTHFSRTPSGRLRRMNRIEGDERGRTSTFKYDRGMILEEWHGSEKQGNLFRFDDDGETLSEQLWENGELVEHTDFYSVDGEKRSLTQNFSEGSTIYREYDDSDRALLERKMKQGDLVEEIHNRYEEDNLVEKKKRTPGLKERWEYQHNEDGDVTVEHYYKHERLVKKIVYSDEDNYYEDIYRNDIPVIRVYYTDDRKTGEEFLEE